jgi:hypothetical protein
MIAMNFHAILTSNPIDRVARRVASQAGVSQADSPLAREELAYLMRRTLRKQRLLKQILGIRTKAQHKNTTYKSNHGVKQFRAEKEPRALDEYLRCGQAIQRLNVELANMRMVRRFVANAENEYKSLMAQRAV